MATNRAQEGLTKSARELAAILEEGGTVAEAIGRAVHRTMLWRFVTGKNKPDADTIAKLSRLSSGRIAGDGWGDDSIESPKTGTEG